MYLAESSQPEGRSASRDAKGAKTDSPAPKEKGGAGGERGDGGGEPIPPPRADSAVIKALNATRDTTPTSLGADNPRPPSPARS